MSIVGGTGCKDIQFILFCAMKVIEIMKLSRNSLELLQKSCIKTDYLKYIDMYDEYTSIVSEGNKKTYAVTYLSDKYGISERQIYYLIRKFEKECKICASI